MEFFLTPALNYLHFINNVEFYWSTALPIFSPSTLISVAFVCSFLLRHFHHYSLHYGHNKLRKTIQEEFKRERFIVRKKLPNKGEAK